MSGYHALVRRARRRIIVGALLLCGGNVGAAARRLRLQRTYVYRLLREQDLSRGQYWGER